MVIIVKQEPAIRPNKDVEPLALAVRRARISVVAGDGVEHRVVGEWLKTWGTADRRPFREWLAGWDG